jgi:uncharacterized protein DUF1553/uncharacterized protein DUF1549/concanavalin A-like lectin/glucanase superfamily protein/cytochrome c
LILAHRSLALLILAAATTLSGAEIHFNRDIRPILSDKCFNCHGHDSTNRATPLRFDTEEGATVELSGGRRAIVAGDPGASEIIARIDSDHPAKRMPPAYMGHEKLSDGDIEKIRQWITGGAKWESHWSFMPPERPDSPAVSDKDWPRNPIDNFILHRLEADGLNPSPEAAAATLARRLSLDITGLPPTPEEVEAFVADPSDAAYGEAADRLLNSPHYGENMAYRWLDAARYADTNGYQSDGVRSMWRWRDWVVDAFNKNKPFDEFTVEQIAGDLLPQATREQIIATGFNRNHRTSAEGGIIAEEMRVEYVADRAETTSTVWLGLTVGCARCHDHKYDPIPQKDFYRLFAYFNNTPDPGFVFNWGNQEPYIKAPTPEQETKLAALDKTLAQAESELAALQPEIDRTQTAWEQSLANAEPTRWDVRDGLFLHYSMEGMLTTGCHEGRPLVRDSEECALPLVPGKIGSAASFDGRRFIDGGVTAKLSFQDPFTLAAWINPRSPEAAILTRIEDVPKGEGYGVYLRDGKIRLHMTKRWTDLGMRLETAAPIELNHWHHIAVAYDGECKASGVRIYVNGERRDINVIFDQNVWPIEKKVPFRIGAGEGLRFDGEIDEVRLYNRAVTAEEATTLPLIQPLNDLARISPRKRTAAQRAKLRLAFLDRYRPDNIATTLAAVRDAHEARQDYYETIPTVMVMQEREEVRETFLLERGSYDARGERLTPDVPSALPPLPDRQPNNRAALARWLVDPGNPLTARVFVNRVWQQFFGAGLVRTVEDFGSQGEWPSHPELLDWLAVEFVESGWDVKQLVRTIVTSATYRQSSAATPELLANDPENRLIARGPRVRLPAPIVRDQALAISGLLVRDLGGPPVKPYQPPGLWKELAFSKGGYQKDSGDDLYRRSLYTYWRRTSPPPGMTTFDAPDRESCRVRESRTNTPLQSLNLMNDETYIEAARHLAERMMLDGGTEPSTRIALAFQLATARPPDDGELRLLSNALTGFKTSYQDDPAAARKYLAVGDSPPNESLDPQELAAYTGVASIIFNLDETITRE